jgi:hypothetical protein
MTSKTGENTPIRPKRPHLLHFLFLGVDILAVEGVFEDAPMPRGVVMGLGGGAGNGIGRC